MDVIDLCDSDEEDRPEEASIFRFSGTPTSQKQTTNKPSASSSTTKSGPEVNLSIEDEVVEILDDSDNENPQSSTALLKPRPINPYKTQAATSVTRLPKVTGTSKPPSNPYQKKRSKTLPRKLLDFDSDSDDDDLLNLGPVFAKKPSPSRSTTSAAVTKRAPETVARLPEGVARLPSILPTSRDFEYPTMLARSKTYQDVRAKFVLAFWKYARKLVHHSHQLSGLDICVKRVVRLALTTHPVRSLEEYCFRKVTSGAVRESAESKANRDKLKAQLEEVGWNRIITPTTSPSTNRKYYSISEACLSAMLSELEIRRARRDDSQAVLSPSDSDEEISKILGDKGLWVSLQYLIPAIDRLLRPECPARLTKAGHDDNGALYYLSPSTRSAEFLQIKILERPFDSIDDSEKRGGFMKRHTRGDSILYELTPLGYRTAHMIRTRQFPEPPGHYRCSRIQTVSQVDRKFQDICLGVDFREGGGGHNALHSMCNALDLKKVPYFVGTLNIGDYVLFTKRNDSDSLNYLCPILVERKSIEDVAMSIHDGRWKAQKRRMYVGQYVFGYENCRMVFIIEGKDQKQAVTGGYIGHRMFNVNMERLNEEIENLKSEGFEVIRTPSRENTMFHLSRCAAQVADDVRTGTLKATWTYTGFNDEVKKIPTGVDFSRLAKDAMARKTARLNEEANNSKRVIELDEGSDYAAADSAKRKKYKNENDQNACKYSDWSKAKLEEACVTSGLAKTGSKRELIARLNGPRPPRLWVERKLKGEYVPQSHDVGSTALLVALYLHECETGKAEMTKDELYEKAEACEITKNPFSGGTTQTGPFHYTGWANMDSLLKGDPPLVVKKKGRYKLTRNSNIAGYQLSEQLHIWCHQNNNCLCQATGPNFAPVPISR